MEITYRLTIGPNAVGWERRRSCAAASREELLWSYFPGDVGIKEGDAQFKTNFGLIPILHFNLSMIIIYERLASAEDAAEDYTFTEADDSLSFRRSRTSVIIKPSFCPVTVVSQMAAMRIAIKSFTHRVISDLGSAYPDLLRNSLAEEMSARAKDL